MSGLAGLLAGHLPPGVYTWHAAFEPDEVRRTVEHAGAVFAHVDGWTAAGTAEFLGAVGTALGFPEWYGQNLDAFEDCLGDLDGSPVLLLWDGWGTLARSEPVAFAAVLDICTERATSPRSAFSLLLRGAGPEIDVPALDG
ncbi:MAG: barstar family protein [Marmoricola sp.]